VPSDLYRYLDNPDMKVTLKLNGKNVPLDIQKGYAVLSREWKSGDTIELVLPMRCVGWRPMKPLRTTRGGSLSNADRSSFVPNLRTTRRAGAQPRSGRRHAFEG
jgi:hypothetical protein